MSENLDTYMSEFTKREHAAISLRIPESGDPDLDAMIRKAQRRDLAGMAMQGLLAAGLRISDSEAAELAVRHTDALLAALDATNGEEV